MNAPEIHPAYAQRPVPAALRAALQGRFGERCSSSTSVREQHGRGESVYDAAPPELVVFCESTEEVAFAVAQAAAHAVPVIPFGVGSSLEGHLLAVQGVATLSAGGALFAAAAKADAERESRLMSAAGLLLTFSLLLWVFRSGRVFWLALPLLLRRLFWPML